MPTPDPYNRILSEYLPNQGKVADPYQDVVDSYRQPAEAAPAEAPASPFTSTLKATGAHIVNSLAGQPLEDIGAQLNNPTLTEAGQGVRQWAEQVQQENPSPIQNLGDIVEHPWDAIQTAAGNVLPQVPLSLAGAYAGGKAGLALPLPPQGKAVAGAVGAGLGMFAPNYLQEAAEMRGKQHETGQEDMAKAYLTAIPAAGLETAADTFQLGKLLPKGAITKALTGDALEASANRLIHAGKQALKGAGVEAGTEYAQTGLEQYGGNQDLSTQQAADERNVSAALGGIGGGLVRGGISAFDSRQTPPPPPPPAAGIGTGNAQNNTGTSPAQNNAGTAAAPVTKVTPVTGQPIPELTPESGPLTKALHTNAVPVAPDESQMQEDLLQAVLPTPQGEPSHESSTGEPLWHLDESTYLDSAGNEVIDDYASPLTPITGTNHEPSQPSPVSESNQTQIQPASAGELPENPASAGEPEPANRPVSNPDSVPVTQELNHVQSQPPENEAQTEETAPAEPARSVKPKKAQSFKPTDELKTVIQKLGGIQYTGHADRAGFTDFKKNRFLFHNGAKAKTLDGMAESLRELGFEVDGENDLTQKLYDSLNGTPHYTPEGWNHHAEKMARIQAADLRDQEAAGALDLSNALDDFEPEDAYGQQERAAIQAVDELDLDNFDDFVDNIPGFDDEDTADATDAGTKSRTQSPFAGSETEDNQFSQSPARQDADAGANSGASEEDLLSPQTAPAAKPKAAKPSGSNADLFTSADEQPALAQQQALADLTRKKDDKRSPNAPSGGELFQQAGIAGQQDVTDVPETNFGNRPETTAKLSPFHQHNGDKERAAADRLDALLAAIEQSPDPRFSRRGLPETNAKDIIKSVVAELRKPVGMDNQGAVLEQASRHLARNFGPMADVVDQVIKQLRDDKTETSAISSTIPDQKPENKAGIGDQTPKPDDLAYNLPKNTVVGGAAEIKTLARQVLNKVIPGNLKKAIRFAIVGQDEAEKVKAATGLDVAGYKHTVDSFGIRHTFRKHGNEKTEQPRGQSAVTPDDIALIPDIVQTPDKIALLGQDDYGNDLIKYEKKIGDTYHYVEVVRNKRQELSLETLWKTRTRETMPGEPSQPLTSTTLGGNPPQDDITIAQAGADAKDISAQDQAQFANNTIFTADKVAAARARLKAKLGTLNSGFDPELALDGLTIAGAYIESGVKTFAAYSKAMVADFGDQIKPYLLSFYEGARAYPGLDNAGMTPADQAAKEHKALLTPAVMAQVKDAVGETPKPKQTLRAGETRLLKQDWGVAHIDGWTPIKGGKNQDTDYGLKGGVKDAFLDDAKKYLNHVAQLLQAEGFEPHRDRKGKAQKPISANEGGPAVSGDVALTMQKEGVKVYVTVGVSALRGINGDRHPQGVAIMARVGTDGPYANNAPNNWHKSKLSSKDLATWLKDQANFVAKAYQVNQTIKDNAFSGKSDEQSQQNYVKNEPPKSDEALTNGTLPGKDLPAGNPATDIPERQSGNRTGGPVAAGLAGARQGTAGERGVQGRLFESTDAGTGSAGEDGGVQPPEQLGESGTVGLEPVATLNDHEITEDLGQGGKETKYKGNIAAIKLIKELEERSTPATLEERKILQKYVGFGALKNVFSPKDKHYAELKALLTPEEYESARASIRNAHYTSRDVVSAMYQALERLGFNGGRILEPSVGSGNFFGMMPSGLRNNSKLHGVELDNLTSRLARQLYPKAVIAASTNFADYKVPANYFDVALGNPPFGSEPLVDSDRSPYSGFSIHNYFLAKMLDKTRPGGIVAAVVTHNFMDVISPKAREFMAARSKFLGAVRLPNTAFKQNAGTEVVTDIVFFQKTADIDFSPEGKEWTQSTDVEMEHPKTGETSTVRINNYFLAHPEHVLGKPTLAGSMHRDGEYTVEPTGDLKAQLATFLKSLPENSYQASGQPLIELEKSDVVIPPGTREGAYFIQDGNIYRRLPDVAGETQTQAWDARNNGEHGRMVGMIELRDLLRNQLKLELSNTSTQAQVEGHRKTLSQKYDAFVRNYGFLNSQTNRRIFIDDTQSELLQALEAEYDAGISKARALANDLEERKPSAKKADILSKRVAFPPEDNIIVSNAQDALLESLNSRGKLDLEYMAQVYDQTPEAIVKELGDMVYQDPESGWQMADDYLSGDVKLKLADAKTAAETDPAFKRNVAALEKVIPKDRVPSEIYAPIGGMWLPPEVYEAFVHEITGGAAKVTYSTNTGLWYSQMNGDGNRVKMTSDYGTPDLTSFEIFQRLMAGKPVEVKRTSRNPDGTTKTYIDEKATEAAKAAADKIKQLWAGWLWKDGERATKLANLFNEKYNRTVNRKFNGEHLTLPGSNLSIKLFKHQKDGVWRGIQDRNMLLDQVVGAGKTFQMAAIAMEFRRLGIAKKPLFIVPNHLTRQWRSEFVKLYPSANVLAADPSDFEKDNRKRLFAKITTGDYDAVIVGHSSIKKVQLSPEIETRFVNEQMTEIANAIEDMKAERGDRNIIRDMEKIKANLEAKLKAIQNLVGSRDDVVYFDELGVDGLFIDELHEFKNLFFTTQKQRISGLGNPKGSGKAFDLFTKVRWLQDTFGENAPLITATGTPVSNSLAEMFTMQRYMQYPEMKREGLHLFDAWASLFGEDEYLYEVAPSGVGYRISQRFSKFKNLGFLMGNYQSFADIITLQDLKDQAAAQSKRFPVPKIQGGRPQNVVAGRSELQTKFYGVPKLKRDDNGKPVFEINNPDEYHVFQNPESKQWLIKKKSEAYATSKSFSTQEDAELELVNQALMPVTELDPNSILGQFSNLRELTRKTNGRVNALSLTNLANKASLDYRLIDPYAPDFEGSKINKAVEKMLEQYHLWANDKGTQIVFCDLSVPLSAKTKAATQEKRIYVKDNNGALTHKKGTLNMITGFEGFPFFLVKNDRTKQFDTYEPMTGTLLGAGFADKNAAKDAMQARLSTDEGREQWLMQREDSPALEADDIAEYREGKGLEVVEGGENEFTPDTVEAYASGSGGFSVYDDIKAKLIRHGVPEREIAFIHDFDTPAKKEDLFKRTKRGDVRFLFGSTPKLGAGTNVQERLVGLHHIDAPWRPSDLEQREGRIIRQGNKLYERDPEGFEVFIGRYATEQTYDTRRWQLLEHKAAGIEQLRKYSGEAELDDVGGEAANAADMKAAASGNPLILEETTLRTEVKKLELLRRAHADSLYSMHSRIKNLEWENQDYYPGLIKQYQGLIATANKHPLPADSKRVPDMKVDGTQVSTREEALTALSHLIDSTHRAGVPGNYSIKFRGLPFELRVGKQFTELNTPTGRMELFGPDENISAPGLLTRFNNYIGNFPARLENNQEQVVKNAAEIADLQKAVTKDFEQEGELKDKLARHAVVQRKLMKSTQLEAVPPKEQAAFKAELESRTEALIKLGYGEAVDEATKFSLADRPAFYSQLERSLANLPPKVDNTGAQNIKLWLQSNADKLGIKKDELHWSGILNWLDLQGKTKISKAEIQAYLQAGGVQVEETQLGRYQGLNDDDYKRWQDLSQKEWDAPEQLSDKEKQELKSLADRLEKASDDFTPPKYENYRTPGGQEGSYRELLLTLPVGKKALMSRDKAIGEIQRERGAFVNISENDVMQKMYGSNYKSSHWDQPNVLAHIRFDERTDADGKRVLFIQEIQSDWGQEGKKKGFGERWALMDSRRVIPEYGYFKSKEEAEKVAAQKNEEKEVLGWDADLTVVRSLEMGLPTAPFVTDTKAWATLALKRATMYAVENGFDKVAFATGEQNADLYSLRKHISKIEYEPSENDDGITEYDVYAYDLDGKEVHHKDGMSIEEIENLLGKEMAEKIANGEGKHTGGAYRDWKELSDLDLETGGEGMKAFYDKLIPQFANDLLKKIGGGKVEPVSFGKKDEYRAIQSDADGGGEVVNSKLETVSFHPTIADARAEARRLNGGTLGTAPSENLGFTLTPNMVNFIAQNGGLPLFRRGQATNAGTVKQLQAWLTPKQRQLVKQGKLKIVQSYPNEPSAKAFYKGGAITLIAGNIGDRNELHSVLSHESWHYARQNDAKVKARLDAIDRQFANAFSLAARGIGTPEELNAYRRATLNKVPEAHRQEEFQSYLIEAWAAQPKSVGERVAKAVRNLIALIRATLIRYAGFAPKDYTVADLAALARTSLKATQNYSGNPASENVLLSAKDEGYQGNDSGEAEEWLRAKAKGLDMSEKARMERALEQGYIKNLEQLIREELNGRNERNRAASIGGSQASEKQPGNQRGLDEIAKPQTFYHGTRDVIAAFEVGHPNRKDKGWLGEGIYFYDKKIPADGHARNKEGEGKPKVMRLFIRPKRLYVSSLAVKAKLKHASDDFIKAYTDNLKRQGYDGAVLPYRDAHEVVIFNPSHIRSIHAAFDPDYLDSPDLLASLAEPKFSLASPTSTPAPVSQANQAAISWLKSKLPEADKVLYNFQDRMVDMLRQVQKVQAQGGTVNEVIDPYLKEELYSQRAASRIDEFYDQQFKPLLQALHDNKLDYDQFQKFLHARHAASRNAVMQSRNPNKAIIAERLQQAEADYTVALEENDKKAMRTAVAEIKKWQRAKPFKGTEAERLSLSGMADADATAYMDSLDPMARKVMTQLGDQIDQINNDTLDLLVQYGMEQPETVAALKAQWEHYVPLHRDEAHPDNSSFGHPVGRGYSIRGTGLSKATGSQAEVTNILAHIAAAREQMIKRGEKNRVTVALGGFLQANPDPEFATLGRIPMRTTLVNGLAETLPDMNYKNRDNVITMRIKGRDIGIAFNEHSVNAMRLAASMKNLDGAQLDTFESIVGRGTRWLSSVNTQYNIIFGLFNFARDVQGSLLNLTTTPLKGKQGEVFKNLGAAFKMIYAAKRNDKLDPVYDRFNKAGGTTGYMQVFDTITKRDSHLRDELAKFGAGKPVKMGRGILKALEDYNALMENTTRLAVFMTGLDNGLSEAKAASLAKNISVNFNRKGAYAAKIGAFYGFYNATVQGNKRLLETLTGSKGKQIIAGGMMLGALATVAAISALGADDYDKIPEWVRERSLILPALWTKNHYVAIPMPLGFHILPNIGRKAAESLFGSNRQSEVERWLGLFNNITGAFNPLGGSDFVSGIIPSVLDPFIDVARNRTFSGSTVYQPEYDPLNPKPGFKQARDSASPLSVMTAEAFNKLTGGSDYRPGLIDLNPDILDYLFGQLFGGTGREALKLENYAEAKLKGEATDLHKTPLLGKVYGETEGNAPERSLYYDNIRLLNQHRSEVQGLIKDRKAKEAAQYLKANPEARVIDLAKRTRSNIEKLMDQRKALEKAGKPVAALNRLITANMKVLNDEVARAVR